ncbi:MAG: hypothetical protein K6G66_08565, partial [Oscillospiraceae bacterium]|nr:hypothetical protein [Oscillospiraceae bacterium]
WEVLVIILKYAIFSPLSGQPKNMAIIHSAISYVSARDLRLFNCRINNQSIVFRSISVMVFLLLVFR